MTFFIIKAKIANNQKTNNKQISIPKIQIPIKLKEIIFLIEESTDGGYEARALGQSIYTGADTIDELKSMIRDAVHCHFDENDVPKNIRL